MSKNYCRSFQILTSTFACFCSQFLDPYPLMNFSLENTILNYPFYKQQQKNLYVFKIIKLTVEGCFLLTSVAAAAKLLQLCPTLCNPIDGSPPGSPVPGILQARTWSGLSCPTLRDPMNCSTPGLPVHHQLREFTQTHVESKRCHRVTDAIQPSHPLSSPSPPAPNPSQHQSLFQ